MQQVQNSGISDQFWTCRWCRNYSSDTSSGSCATNSRGRIYCRICNPRTASIIAPKLSFLKSSLTFCWLRTTANCPCSRNSTCQRLLTPSTTTFCWLDFASRMVSETLYWTGYDHIWLIGSSAFATACFDLRQQQYATGFRKSAFIYPIHGEPDRHHQGSWSSLSSVCRRHTDSCCPETLDTLQSTVRLSRWGVKLDAFELATAKYYKDRDTLVYDISLASATANYRRRSWCQLHLPVVSCSRSGHHDRQWRQYAIACIMDCIWLFCGSTSDTQPSAIRIRICLHVAGRFAHHATSTLRQHHARWTSREPAPPTAVSAQCCHQTDLPEKSVRTRHTSSARASLATVQRACRLQTCCSHLPLFTRSGATLPSRWHTSCRRHQLSTPALVIVSSTDCETNSTGDHGRPCLPGRRQSTLEHSAARRHICSHTVCLL